MFGLQSFSVLQRAMTLTGLAPVVLLGCAVHENSQAVAGLPAPTYSVSMLVPPARARPVLRPVAPQALRTNIDTLVRGFDGVVGVSVKSVDDGWSVDANPERKLPQQSVSKLWVAMTVMHLRDQGRLTLNDMIEIRRGDLTLFHQPVASLLKDGVYQTTIRDLLVRALTMSDNTANDRLLRLVGGPQAVRAFIQRNALGEIRFGPGERLLQSRTAGLEWRQEYAMGNAFALARSRLPASVRQAAFEAYVADPPDGASASAIADALLRLKRGELLSKESTDWLIDTMSNTRTGRARIRAACPPGWTIAHKTGTGQDLASRTAGFNDVGILTAPDGKTYAIAVMIGDTRRPPVERQQLIQAVVASVVANHRS